MRTHETAQTWQQISPARRSGCCCCCVRAYLSEVVVLYFRASMSELSRGERRHTLYLSFFPLLATTRLGSDTRRGSVIMQVGVVRFALESMHFGVDGGGGGSARRTTSDSARATDKIGNRVAAPLMLIPVSIFSFAALRATRSPEVARASPEGPRRRPRGRAPSHPVANTFYLA